MNLPRKLILAACLMATPLQGFVFHCADDDCRSIALAFGEHCGQSAACAGPGAGSSPAGETAPCCVDSPLGAQAVCRTTVTRTTSLAAAPVAAAPADSDRNPLPSQVVPVRTDASPPALGPLQSIVLLI